VITGFAENYKILHMHAIRQKIVYKYTKLLSFTHRLFQCPTNLSLLHTLKTNNFQFPESTILYNTVMVINIAIIYSSVNENVA